MTLSSKEMPGIGLGEPITFVAPTANANAIGSVSLSFQLALLDNMRDGAIFVDPTGRIRSWSQTVEVMTGMSSGKVIGTMMTPGLLRLSDVNGIEISKAACPVQECLRTGRKKCGEFKIVGRSGRETKVEMTFVPVKTDNGTLEGAIILLHDSSVQMDLKRQLKDLYEFSMLDPLTQVANRAEFERVLDQYVQANHTSDFACSIIICDIDFFKSINDNYNHHVGDQALISFAGLLKKFVRSQDIVARYGGEEFVILCGDCDRQSAVQRAEEIRVTLTKTPQQMLDGKCITASFGVAELQKSDSATDFFVRADTALLRAKELGRNQVVEAGSSMIGGGSEMKSATATSLSGVKWRNFKGSSLICEEFFTSAPLPVLVEKLRGYIIESEAEIRQVEPDFATVLIQIADEKNNLRKTNFVVDVELQERQASEDVSLIGNRTKTFIRITIREGKRKWFSGNSPDLASTLLRDIRRYLMISDENSKLKIAPAVTRSTRDE
jgi:diguanylate cyclase (GGDEF)-like protein/PAS domain S-box-containing protein